MIEASASGQREVRRHGEVVLSEGAWHDERVVESRHIVRRVGIAFDREPGDPRLEARRSTDRRFTKRGVVPIPFEDLAVLMIVILSCNCRARGHDVSVLDQELAHRTGIVSSRVEPFHVGLAGGEEHLAIRRAAVAILVCEAGCRKEGSAATAIPEHPGAHDGSRIAWEIRPRIGVDVVGLLPVAATEQRTTPPPAEGTREKRDRVRPTARRAVEQELLFGLGTRTPRQEVDDATHRPGAI